MDDTNSLIELCKAKLAGCILVHRDVNEPVYAGFFKISEAW